MNGWKKLSMWKSKKYEFKEIILNIHVSFTWTSKVNWQEKPRQQSNQWDVHWCKRWQSLKNVSSTETIYYLKTRLMVEIFFVSLKCLSVFYICFLNLWIYYFGGIGREGWTEWERERERCLRNYRSTEIFVQKGVMRDLICFSLRKWNSNMRFYPRMKFN